MQWFSKLEAVCLWNKIGQAAANTGSSDYIFSCDIWVKYWITYCCVHKFYSPLQPAKCTAFSKRFIAIFNRHRHFSWLSSSPVLVKSNLTSFYVGIGLPCCVTFGFLIGSSVLLLAILEVCDCGRSIGCCLLHISSVGRNKIYVSGIKIFKNYDKNKWLSDMCTNEAKASITYFMYIWCLFFIYVRQKNIENDSRMVYTTGWHR